MKMKRIGLFLLLLLLSIVMIGCNNDSDKSGESKDNKAATEGNKKYKDELNVAITAQPPTLDSAMTVSQVALDVAGNIFETLYTLDADYEPTPMLAESVDISEDAKRTHLSCEKALNSIMEKK